MSRGLSILFVIASLIALAGCSVSVGDGGTGGPFPGENVETVSVQPSFESEPVRENVTLSAGQSRIYRVDISSTVAQENDVVYFDAVPTDGTRAEGYLEVTAYSVSGSSAEELYVSRSPSWFGRPDDPGLSTLSLSTEYEQTSVGTTPSCGGPCILVPTPSGAGTAYIRVEALQGTTTFDLYVVATEYADIGEPNDSFQNAESVGGDLFIQGAIESIGDTDWYVSAQDVESVEFFAANPDLNLFANVYTESGSYRDTIASGETYILPLSDPLQQLRIEVYSDNSQPRAGAPGGATYSLQFE